MLSPEQRAEKIINDMPELSDWRCGGEDIPENIDRAKMLIASEIRAAVEEALIVMAEELTKADREHVKQGRALAFQQAAKVAENSFLDWELWLVDHSNEPNLIAERAFIAQQIRRLAGTEHDNGSNEIPNTECLRCHRSGSYCCRACFDGELGATRAEAFDRAAKVCDELTDELDAPTDTLLSVSFKKAIKKMNGSVVSEECAERIRRLAEGEK